MMNTLNTENPIEKPFRKTGDPVDLTSESPLHPRRKSRRIMVGPVPVGGGAPISVQSMTNTLTANVPATLQQIAELTAAGCDIVRVAVPSQDDADALPEICLQQVKEMCTKLYAAHTNIDYFPTNFILWQNVLYYVDYECNAYMEEWNFENWGIKYWSKTKEFLEYERTH